MDISTVMSLAKQNQKSASTQKKIGYSTEIKPPKKLEKKVNPEAVKALLNRRKEMERIQLEEAMKKKSQLQKLREEKRHTGKARAMATRTKDNPKIYKGEDYLGRRKNGQEVELSAEADMKHKAFMKKLMDSTKSNGVQLQDDRNYDKAASEKHNRKMEKVRKRAREASHFDFKNLMNLAQEQSSKRADESSSSSDESSSDEDLDPAERYEKERRKRKKLEARLKAMKNLKRKSNDVAHEAPNLKIPKLSTSLSEESKQAQVRALMTKFNQKSSGKLSVPASSNPNSAQLNNKKKSNCSKSTSATEIKKQCVNSSKITPSNHPKDSKKLTSQNKQPNNTLNKNLKKESNISKAVTTLDRRKNLNSSNNGFSLKQKQSTINFPAAQSNKNKAMLQHKLENLPKKAPNPYAEIMQKAQSNLKTKPCTLSVKNTMVRTNYPGVAETDPKQPNYEKIKVPSRAMLEEYRRRAARGNSGIQRRMQVLRDEYDSEEEYDSEMEGFIDDGEEGLDNDISAQIGAIFGYDKSKYGRESEYELSKMDASYKDIQREESRALRIALQEDAREAKLLEDEEKRKKKKRK